MPKQVLYVDSESMFVFFINRNDVFIDNLFNINNNYRVKAFKILTICNKSRIKNPVCCYAITGQLILVLYVFVEFTCFLLRYYN